MTVVKKKGAPLTETEKQNVLKMYKEGFGTSAIACRLRLSVTMIAKACKEAGIYRDQKTSFKLGIQKYNEQKNKRPRNAQALS